MQQLLKAAGRLLLFITGLVLLAVMAADSWLGCNAPMPKHPVMRFVAGPVLQARVQRWHSGNVIIPHEQVATVLSALAAVVLGLCCKQRCWFPSVGKLQPSQLCVALARLTAVLHSAKYAFEVCMTGLTRNTPWMGVHHLLAIATFIMTASEPGCICVMLTVPYLMHELYSAVGTSFTGLTAPSSLLTRAVTASVGVYHIAVFVLACAFVYCGCVQRIIPRHVGLLVAALMCVDYAAHCSMGSGSYCLVEYDSSLDAFYALAEGRRSWLVLFKAGAAAFAVAAAVLSCVFVLLCWVVQHMPGGRAMQHSCARAGSASACNGVSAMHLQDESSSKQATKVASKIL